MPLLVMASLREVEVQNLESRAVLSAASQVLPLLETVTLAAINSVAAVFEAEARSIISSLCTIANLSIAGRSIHRLIIMAGLVLDARRSTLTLDLGSIEGSAVEGLEIEDFLA